MLKNWTIKIGSETINKLKTIAEQKGMKYTTLARQAIELYVEREIIALAHIKERSKKMRKIINRKVYDTSKAEMIAEWDNSYNRTDFHYCAEELYKTPRGNWFVYGYGGPASKYAQSAGQNSWTGGEDIIALKPDDARDWLVEKGFTELVEKHFGDQLEEA